MTTTTEDTNWSPEQIAAAKSYFGANPTPDQLYAKAAELKLNPTQLADVWSKATGGDYATGLQAVNDYLTATKQTLPGGFSTLSPLEQLQNKYNLLQDQYNTLQSQFEQFQLPGADGNTPITPGAGGYVAPTGPIDVAPPKWTGFTGEMPTFNLPKAANYPLMPPAYAPAVKLPEVAPISPINVGGESVLAKIGSEKPKFNYNIPVSASLYDVLMRAYHPLMAQDEEGAAMRDIADRYDVLGGP